MPGLVSPGQQRCEGFQEDVIELVCCQMCRGTDRAGAANPWRQDYERLYKPFRSVGLPMVDPHLATQSIKLMARRLEVNTVLNISTNFFQRFNMWAQVRVSPLSSS